MAYGISEWQLDSFRRARDLIWSLAIESQDAVTLKEAKEVCELLTHTIQDDWEFVQ